MPKKTIPALVIAAFLTVLPFFPIAAAELSEHRSVAESDTTTMKRLSISKGATISDDDFLLFLKRIRANSKLDAALQDARRDGNRIYATSYFLKGSRAVLVDVHGTDEAIIEFVRKR